MGIELIYTAEGREWSLSLSLAEWDTLSLLESHLPDALAVMTGVAEIGEEMPVALDQLRTAIDEVDAFLRDQAEKLPLSYAYKKEYIEVNGSRYHDPDQEFCTGRMSGIRFSDDEDHYYEISAGLDECRLVKTAVQSDGHRRIVETRDLRGEQFLQTRSLGRVEFQSFREKTGIRDRLRETQDFLATLNGPEVLKRISA